MRVSSRVLPTRKIKGLLFLSVDTPSDTLLASIRTDSSPRLALVVFRQVLLELLRAIEILCELFPD